MALLVWKSLLYHYLKVILNCVCVYSIDPPLPHLLFLIICVTFYFLLSSHIFLIFYYLVTLMLILILLTVFILTFVTSWLVFHFLKLLTLQLIFLPMGDPLSLIWLLYLICILFLTACSVIPQLSNSDHLGLTKTPTCGPYFYSVSQSLGVQARWLWQG